MIKRIFNSRSHTITGAAIILAGATLLNKIIGIARDRSIAHIYGASSTTDVYYVAFKIPDLIYGLLVIGALSAGFIPVFTKLLRTNKGNAWKLANNTINILAVTLIILCGLGIIFTPQLTKIIAPGFEFEKQKTLISFMRIMFLSPVLLGVSMVAGGILQSMRLFLIYSIAPIFYNAGIIFGAWCLIPIFGSTGLAWGVVLGAFLHLSLQFYGATQAGFRWKWHFDIKDKNTRTIGKLMVPRTMGLAITNINIIITAILASLLPAGSVAALSFADNLQWVPIGIIGISLALASFPILSEAIAENKKSIFIQVISSTIRQIIFLIVPISLIFLILRAQIVRVVFGSGAFDWTATTNTANALAFFALGMLAQSLIPLLARGFYALSDTKTPFVIGVISGLCNIIFAILLMNPLGVSGLALAGAIGATINMSLLFIMLRKTMGNLKDTEILHSVYRISIAGLTMAITMQLLKNPLSKIFNQDYFWGIFGQGAIAGLTGLFLYGFICYILKLQEFIQFKNSWQKRWLKIKNLPTESAAEIKEQYE